MQSIKNLELFPADINVLIQKCENTIVLIKERFANPNCLLVKELYNIENNARQKDFITKLQINCNTKLNSEINNELKGIYVFSEMINGNIVPVYIGISRTVFRRLRQHTFGTNINSATLAHLKAKERLGLGKISETLIKLELQVGQEKIKNYRLVVIPEMNDYDLYFMEVYIAGKLKTKWNNFKTH